MDETLRDTINCRLQRHKKKKKTKRRKEIVCVHARVRACVRACVHAYVVSVSLCVRACVYERVGNFKRRRSNGRRRLPGVIAIIVTGTRSRSHDIALSPPMTEPKQNWIFISDDNATRSRAPSFSALLLAVLTAASVSCDQPQPFLAAT